MTGQITCEFAREVQNNVQAVYVQKDIVRVNGKGAFPLPQKVNHIRTVLSKTMVCRECKPLMSLMRFRSLK